MMNKSLAIIFFLISIGSAAAYFQSNKTTDVVKSDISRIVDYPFLFLFEANELEDDKYNLEATIRLEDGSFAVSPFSKDDIYGHFTFDFAEGDKFSLEGSLIEIPVSVEEFDPIIEKPVRFVRENTTYQQTIKLNTKEDFQTIGMIEFLLEPSCVPYNVEFMITYRSGKMSFKHMRTTVSKEYKK